MLLAITPPPSPVLKGYIKFTNCRVVRGQQLLGEDIWICASTGRIVDAQQVFYSAGQTASQTIDLGGRILAPSFIDVQINGAFGFDFAAPADDPDEYVRGLQRVNKSLIRTGVTSYLPTLPSQSSKIYREVLLHLGPSGSPRFPFAGAESLGAHLEGPFISPSNSGVHDPAVIVSPLKGLTSLEDTYGRSNLHPNSNVKLVTIAPELPGAINAIKNLKALGIRTAIGHSKATYEEACAALNAGATMITHLFNAMPGLHHRNPGIFGLLAAPPSSYGASSPKNKTLQKPYFGLIADGHHLHPTALATAHAAHPEGTILVTDAQCPLGMPDGTYSWGTNGTDCITKKGSCLTLERTGGFAGAVVTLLDCVNNFRRWTGASLPVAIGTVTATPAEMLGLEGVKGSLDAGADADLVVLEETADGSLAVRQVWKFGTCVYDMNGQLGPCIGAET